MSKSETLNHLLAVVRAHGVTLEELKEQAKTQGIPISIFGTRLSPLQALVRYCHEHLDLTFSQIARTLGRDPRTIGNTYRSAIPQIQLPIAPRYTLPINILADRSRSILEHVCLYLKDTYGLKFCQIARIINRDERTVWTVYRRAKRK